MSRPPGYFTSGLPIPVTARLRSDWEKRTILLFFSGPSFVCRAIALWRSFGIRARELGVAEAEILLKGMQTK